MWSYIAKSYSGAFILNKRESLEAKQLHVFLFSFAVCCCCRVDVRNGFSGPTVNCPLQFVQQAMAMCNVLYIFKKEFLEKISWEEFYQSQPCQVLMPSP